MHAFPEIPDLNIYEAAIAESIGFEGLWGHYFNTIWTLQVLRAFKACTLLGVAATRGGEFRGKSSPGRIKGFLASGSVAVQELEFDSLANVIARLPLLDKNGCGFRSRDGVRYLLRTETLEVEGILHFANPTLPELLSVIRTSCGLAETVSRNSRDESLLEFTKSWRACM